jgi:hypothetical protein
MQVHYSWTVQPAHAIVFLVDTANIGPSPTLDMDAAATQLVDALFELVSSFGDELNVLTARQAVFTE